MFCLKYVLIDILWNSPYKTNSGENMEQPLYPVFHSIKKYFSLFSVIVLPFLDGSGNFTMYIK